MYITHFAVEGAGQFPIDMLRYDSCHPRTSADAAAIEERGRRKVHLTGYHHTKHLPCTPERWRSFNWKVVDSFDTERA